jgi:hypothetical protein
MTENFPGDDDDGVDTVDLETQERVTQLLHDLEHNPAIACPITYKWHGNQEFADRASIKRRIWAQLMQQQWLEMSFGLG